MDILSITIIIFAGLELCNVFLMYFKPESKKANAMGVFDRFVHLSSDDPNRDLIYYLVNWVAGTKLIFISLIIMLAIFADEKLKIMTIFVLILSIISYFWRLSPLIKKMDGEGLISPKGYAKTLDIMIGSFVFIFSGVLIYYYFF